MSRVVVCVALLVCARASANSLDLSLNGLGVPAANNEVAKNFRLLTTELAFALSPRTLAPAETLGIAGFEFGFDATIVGLNTGAAYWQNVTEQQQRKGTVPGGTNAVTGFHFRKGLPFSFEVEGHLNYLLNSSMFMLGADLRYSFLEGYKYVPNIAVRAGVGRLFNASDIDMTTFNLDATLSKTFPVAGVMTITPMVGWGALFINVYSAVLDTTPTKLDDNTSLSSDGSLYTLANQSLFSALHNRVFGALRLQTFIFAFYYQLDVGLITKGPVIFMNTFKLALDF